MNQKKNELEIDLLSQIKGSLEFLLECVEDLTKDEPKESVVFNDVEEPEHTLYESWVTINHLTGLYRETETFGEALSRTKETEVFGDALVRE